MAATTVIFTDSDIPARVMPKKLNLAINDLNNAIAAGGGPGTGTGDMLKSTYDTNNNGVVDTADAIGWTSVTGKPTTFPPDSTAMLRSVYDTNANNVVDTCDSLAWAKLTGIPASFTPSAHASTHLSAASDPIALATSVLAGLCPAVDNTTIQVVASKLSCVALAWTAITGKPSTFPPDSTAMLKSVYDANADNIVDHAALADTAPWTGVTGKPATFPPSAHATTHEAGGSDIIPLDTLGATTDITTLNSSTTAHGLLRKLDGTTTNFLRGDGTWVAPPTGTGDMTKAVYDTNANNIVDKAEALSTAGAAHQFWKNGNVWGQPDWSDLTGVPTGIYLTDPGTWTTLSAASGWSAGTVTPQYRIEVTGSIKTVYCRGIFQAIYTNLGTTAFTFPSAAFPTAARSNLLGGAQNTGTASDVAAYIATVSTAGVVTIYFLGGSAFVWGNPAMTQLVYLDSLIFSL